MSVPPAEVHVFSAGAANHAEDKFRAHVIDQLGELREAMGDVATPAAIKQAVEDGTRSALANPETWASAMAGIQKAAQQEAGGWLFGGIRAFFSKAAWVLLIGLGVYLLGGWTALVAFLKGGATT